jgi:hypothetical protein
MVARGVFKETTKRRVQPMEPEAKMPGAGSGRGAAPLTDHQKEVIRDALNDYLKPYLRT